MKIRLTIKDPDVMYDAVDETLDKEFPDFDFDDEETELLRNIRKGKLIEILGKWFKWGEYIGLEVDTETKTIRVLESEEV